MNDNINVTGQFNIKVIKNNKIIDEYTDDNLVLFTGRSALAHALASGEGVRINRIDLGTGGHDTSDVTAPKPGLEVGAEELEELHTSKDLTDVTSTGNVLTVRVTIEADEGLTDGGSTGFSEAALGLSTGTLFSIKRFGIKTKTPDTSFEITWTVTF